MRVSGSVCTAVIVATSLTALGGSAGGITAPEEGSCHGPSRLPVIVEDDFGDDPALTRRYDPPGGVEQWIGAQAADIARDGALLAIGEPNIAPIWGAVHLLRRVQDVLVFEQLVVPDEPRRNAWFGRSVDVDADTLAVGEPGHLGNGGVYLFRLGADGWYEQTRLMTPDTDGVGWAVDLRGEVLAVGGGGAAYVYRRSGDVWEQEARLSADPPGYDDHFGDALVMLEDELFVGAYQFGPGYENQGAVFRFLRGADEWQLVERLQPSDLTKQSNFGSALATDGQTLVVGAFGVHDDQGQTRYGSAYVYEKTAAGEWWMLQKLYSPDLYDGKFGSAVSIDGDVLAVSEPNAWVDGQSRAGAVHFWKPKIWGRNWRYDRRFVAPNPLSSAYFGSSLDIDGSVLVASAPGWRDVFESLGAVYVDGATPRSWYWIHGDQHVTLEVRDEFADPAFDDVSFIIDLRPPEVRLLHYVDDILWPAEIPSDDLFSANDMDGATGEVVLERMFWDDCLIFDGDVYGDGDGLLEDEILKIDDELLCEAILRCGLALLDEPEIRVEATDCGGNTADDVGVYPISPLLLADDCI